MRRRRRTDYLVITAFLLVSGFYIGSVFSSVDQAHRYRTFVALRNASVASVSGAPPSNPPPYRLHIALEQMLLHPAMTPDPQIIHWHPTPRPTTTIVPNRSQSPASELIKETPKPEEPKKPQEEVISEEKEPPPRVESPGTMPQNTSAPAFPHVFANGTASSNTTNVTVSI